MDISSNCSILSTDQKTKYIFKQNTLEMVFFFFCCLYLVLAQKNYKSKCLEFKCARYSLGCFFVIFDSFINISQFWTQYKQKSEKHWRWQYHMTPVYQAPDIFLLLRVLEPAGIQRRKDSYLSFSLAISLYMMKNWRKNI